MIVDNNGFTRPDICADSGFLVFIQGLMCKIHKDGEKYKRHKDIKVASARHVYTQLNCHQMLCRLCGCIIFK